MRGIIEVSKNKCTLLTEEVIDTNSVSSINKTKNRQIMMRQI